MQLAIDHVPVAWSDLDEVRAEFERLGFAPEFGGEHDNGVTHMAVVGFPDRSYVELIAAKPDDPGPHFPFWPDHVLGDGGPAAWCVRVDDAAEEAKRLIDADVPVSGPWYGTRDRDDGTLVEWDRVEFGDDATRQVLPFAIADRTPLEYRVPETESSGPFGGVGAVVVAVPDLEGAVDLFRRAYRIPRPVVDDRPDYGATVAGVPGRPLFLAEPHDGSWLADRLDRFGPGPCACLLAADDLDAVGDEHPVGDPESWPTGRVAWFETEMLDRQLGVLAR
ncbi:VOC family protein [Halobacteriales archaeon QS_1_68_20]|nr:MAG: VOC family protein [Halobacteriales archaeon QS_1_68_20]